MIQASDFPFHNFTDYNFDRDAEPFIIRRNPFVHMDLFRSSKPLPGKPGKMRTTPKISRNAPCQCGSGKKQKKCCGLVPSTDPETE